MLCVPLSLFMQSTAETPKSSSALGEPDRAGGAAAARPSPERAPLAAGRAESIGGAQATAASGESGSPGNVTRPQHGAAHPVCPPAEANHACLLAPPPSPHAPCPATKALGPALWSPTPWLDHQPPLSATGSP